MLDTWLPPCCAGILVPVIPFSTDGNGTIRHVRFWERNGSGGMLSAAVRSGHRAWLDAADVRERRTAVGLPGRRSVRIEGVRGSNPLSSTQTRRSAR